MDQGTPAPSLERLSAELVLYTGRLIRALSRSTARNVPNATLRLLSQLDELAPATIGALAAADNTSQPTMSAGVQNLVDKGWATKTPNPADARSSLVRLTDAGRAELEAARHARAVDVSRRLRNDPAHDEQDLEAAVAVLRGLLEHNPEITRTRDDEGTA